MSSRYIRVPVEQGVARNTLVRAMANAACSPKPQVSQVVGGNFYVLTDDAGIDAAAERLRQGGVDHECLTRVDLGDVDVTVLFV